MELRMPKSPQPGHQSTWTSVLYCCSANFFGAAAAASGMGHHDLLLLLGKRRSHALDDLVPRKWPAVVLEDVVVERHTGLLGNQRAELRGVIVLDQHRQTGVSQDRRDGIGREGAHQADLQVVHRAAVILELAHGVEDGALGRAPGHQRQVGLARIMAIRFSMPSVMWPSGSCSSLVVEKIPPGMPGSVRGLMPSAVSAWRR